MPHGGRVTAFHTEPSRLRRREQRRMLSLIHICASVVEKLTSGVKALIKLNKITLVEGNAKFISTKTVKVEDKEYTADRIIIAAGSYPIIPDIPGVKDSRACIDSTACLALDHIPESMLVIGGGVIGLELGTVYRRYGTKVKVIEATERLLPLMDGELTCLLYTSILHYTRRCAGYSG